MADGVEGGRCYYVPYDVPAAVVHRLGHHAHEPDASPAVHQVHAPRNL